MTFYTIIWHVNFKKYLEGVFKRWLQVNYDGADFEIDVNDTMLISEVKTLIKEAKGRRKQTKNWKMVLLK